MSGPPPYPNWSWFGPCNRTLPGVPISARLRRVTTATSPRLDGHLLTPGDPGYEAVRLASDLDLEQRSFKQDINMHHYAIRAASQASPC